MALTPTIENSQAFVFSITGGATGSEQLSQAFVLAVANFPTESIENSQDFVLVVTEGATHNIELSQAWVTVVARGRVDDPKVRAWTFTLDGHDYYVLRAGNIETLVYDTHNGQWYVWSSFDTDLWKAFNGTNWINSGGLPEEFGSNIVVGDDANGALYFLDPEQFTDDDALAGDTNPKTFTREFQGQVTKRGYDYEKVFSVELLGSIGQMDVSTLTDVTLSYSDDRGLSYVDAGTITIPNNDTSKRVDWRSLGSFTLPGRMFKVTDTGALHRIDNLTIETDKEG